MEKNSLISMSHTLAIKGIDRQIILVIKIKNLITLIIISNIISYLVAKNQRENKTNSPVSHMVVSKSEEGTCLKVHLFPPVQTQVI